MYLDLCLFVEALLLSFTLTVRSGSLHHFWVTLLTPTCKKVVHCPVYCTCHSLSLRQNASPHKHVIKVDPCGKGSTTRPNMSKYAVHTAMHWCQHLNCNTLHWFSVCKSVAFVTAMLLSQLCQRLQLSSAQQGDPKIQGSRLFSSSISRVINRRMAEIILH